MRCPNCRNKVLQKSGDTIRLRTHGPLEFNSEGSCKTRCHWCKSDVELPIELKEGTLVPGETFVLRK